MKQIPTQKENPNGLHQRYVVKKLVPKTSKEIQEEIKKKDKHRLGFGVWYNEYKEIDPDKNAEYFIMRLDEGGSDLKHIAACRIGVHAYATAIEPHIPQLAKDLRERYPLLSVDQNPERSATTEAQ